MPQRVCSRCKSGQVSNVTIEVQGQDYRLCEKCFREYLTVDVMDDSKQVEFIRGNPPGSFLGKLWYWIKRVVRAIVYE